MTSKAARVIEKQHDNAKHLLMLRRLYDWTLSLAGHRRALWALGVVSFFEASVFPVPPDVLMIAMIMAAPQRAFLIALVCTLTSVAGGLFGYALGAFAFETIGRPLLTALGEAQSMAAFNEQFNAFGFWTVLVAGITPFPFKVITIMSGWTGMPLAVFLGSALIARALRFFVVAVLLWKFGPPIRAFIEARLGLVFSLFVLLLFGGFALVRWL